MQGRASSTAPGSPDLGRWLRTILEIFAVALVYVALAKSSLALASINPSASPIWPPTGFALATVLLLGYRVWPAIFVAAFIVNVTTAGSVATSLAIAMGNTLESAVGAYLINRWSHGVGTFETPAGVGRFAATCLVTTPIAATTGVVSLSAAGFADWSSFSTIWLTWWVGDLAGALLITPVIVLWTRNSARTFGARTLARSIGVFALAIVIGFVAFSPLSRQISNSGALAFLSVVPLMWAALQHNQRDTATTALVLAVFAVWGAVSGDGPFVRSSLNETFLVLLAFMISISVPSLALSAHVAVRERHERHIEDIMLELSHRSKNLLAVVQGIARQVAQGTKDYKEFDKAFSERIGALADMHDLLVARHWEGADIREVIRSQFLPFGERQLRTEGAALILKPKAVEHIGLVLHELATNATKYGALSRKNGSVSIRWRTDPHGGEQQKIEITWQESGGPSVAAPGHNGFGHMVITQLAPKALGGRASVHYAKDGFTWTFVVPLANVAIDVSDRSDLTGAPLRSRG